jgi:hypothetical protein
MINPRVRELMEQAGYAAPELAARAHVLMNLVVREFADHLESELTTLRCQDHWDMGFRAGLTHALNELEKFYGVVHPEVK